MAIIMSCVLVSSCGTIIPYSIFVELGYYLSSQKRSSYSTVNINSHIFIRHAHCTRSEASQNDK